MLDHAALCRRLAVVGAATETVIGTLTENLTGTTSALINILLNERSEYETAVAAVRQYQCCSAQ
jgi:hypothetical protein